MNNNLTDIDYVNGIPKCIQYKNLVDEGNFNNPFYLYPSNKHKNIVGSVYYIIGGIWNLRIESYDPETGILTGRPCLYLDDAPMTFKAIPIDEGIKGMYKCGIAEIDDANYQKLNKLKNYNSIG